MRRIIAVVVLVFFVLNCASTLPRYDYRVYEREQPVVISERVGDTIDPEESERFDLFAGIENFERAQFYALEDGGYVVEITADGFPFFSVITGELSMLPDGGEVLEFKTGDLVVRGVGCLASLIIYRRSFNGTAACGEDMLRIFFLSPPEDLIHPVYTPVT